MVPIIQSIPNRLKYDHQPIAYPYFPLYAKNRQKVMQFV
jgi:hypothetical protein